MCAVFVFPSRARFACGLYLCFRPTPASLVGCFCVSVPRPLRSWAVFYVSVPRPRRSWAVFVFLSHARFAGGLYLCFCPMPALLVGCCCFFSHARPARRARGRRFVSCSPTPSIARPVVGVVAAWFRPVSKHGSTSVGATGVKNHGATSLLLLYTDVPRREGGPLRLPRLHQGR